MSVQPWGYDAGTGNSLVRQVPTPGHRARARLVVLDVVVKVDEGGLDGSDKLNRYVERDGDDVLERDQTVEEREKTVDVGVVVGLVGEQRPV